MGVFFILGLIGETKEDIQETIKFAHKLKKLGASTFQFSIATPLYGTELYDIAESGGFLREEFSDEALAAIDPLIETEEFTAEDIRQLCAQANQINQGLTRDRLVKAIRNPKKAIRAILGKMN